MRKHTLVLLIIACIAVGCREKRPAIDNNNAGGDESSVNHRPQSDDGNYRVVTLDGRDQEVLIREINLWKDYNNRAAGISGRAYHGDKVHLIKQTGNGCLIQTQDGIRGWVTYYFIKEIK